MNDASSILADDMSFVILKKTNLNFKARARGIGFQAHRVRVQA